MRMLAMTTRARYLLFVLNTAGVPSHGAWLHLT
jgi:hypothetical protein